MLSFEENVVSACSFFGFSVIISSIISSGTLSSSAFAVFFFIFVVGVLTVSSGMSTAALRTSTFVNVIVSSLSSTMTSAFSFFGSSVTISSTLSSTVAFSVPSTVHLFSLDASSF